MERNPLFSIPLYTEKVADPDALNAGLREDILAWRKEDPQGMPRSTGGGGWHSRIDAFQRPAFEGLVKTIVQQATEVFKAERYSNCNARLIELWANINERGGYNTPHTHGESSDWSGVYYVDLPKGAPPIGFLAPHRGQLQAVEAEAGTMLLFPSWLMHHVPPHEGKKPRISVSFNISKIDLPPRPPVPSFVNVPGVLDKDDISRVYALLAGKKWMKGLVRNGEETPGRVSKVLFADGTRKGSEWQWLHDKIARQAGIVNNEIYKVDISAGGDIQFARYGPGGKYDAHEDRGGSTPGAATRTLSCSIVLREARKGGGIAFPRSDEAPEHVAPGDAVFFAATEPHAALPVKKGVRDSLIVWFNEAGRLERAQ